MYTDMHAHTCKQSHGKILKAANTNTHISINQYLSASCHTALGHKLAQNSTIHKQTTHSHKLLI